MKFVATILVVILCLTGESLADRRSLFGYFYMSFPDKALWSLDVQHERFYSWVYKLNQSISGILSVSFFLNEKRPNIVELKKLMISQRNNNFQQLRSEITRLENMDCVELHFINKAKAEKNYYSHEITCLHPSEATYVTVSGSSENKKDAVKKIVRLFFRRLKLEPISRETFEARASGR